jgi:nicotinamide riboside kinase
MVESSMNRVFFITGAESTGKSTLTADLAKHFQGVGIPEYARTYLESINRQYNYSDVETIARHQVGLIYQNRNNRLVFFDTCLIILKVWFREVYNVVPNWLEEEIPQAGQGIYLLCEPDLPWQFDPLRENPHRREYLSEQYVKELKAAGFIYFRIFGNGEQRVWNAIEVINRLILPDTGKT